MRSNRAGRTSEINPLQMAVCEGFSFPKHDLRQGPACFSLSGRLQRARYAVGLHALGTAQAPFIRVKEARPHETPYRLDAADAPLSGTPGFVPNVKQNKGPVLLAPGRGGNMCNLTTV